MEKLKHIYVHFGFYLPLLIAFLLPFGINYAIFILFWGLCFFTLDNTSKGLKQVFKNKWSLIFIGFFILHVIGYFYTKNKAEALSAIEIKLSFLAFPILFFASNYNDVQIKKIIISFVSGSVLASVLLLFRAIYLLLFHHTNSFFYSDFAYFIHPSYFAMYLVFAQLIVMIFYKKWLGHLQNLNFKIGFISVIFITTIFLCSSKMGLISAFILLPTTLCVQLYHKGYKKMMLGIVTSILLFMVLIYNVFPNRFDRFKTAFQVTASSQTIDKTDAESTAVRILIWKESIKIIEENSWFGTSPADANETLYKAYEKEGLTGAFQKKLNAHNQYLQTFIGTGIIGFILLLLMTVGVLVYGFIKKNYILVLFSVLIIFNFMVESMLQAQAGFTFFAFFVCLILRYKNTIRA